MDSNMSIDESDDQFEILTPEATLSQEPPVVPHSVHARLYSLNNDKFPHINFESDVLSFGRKRTCDIVFSLAEVSGVHCKIYRSEKTKGESVFTLHDHSSNGCFVNSVLVGKDKSAALNHGDYLTFVSPSPETKIYMAYIFQINSKLYNSNFEENQDVVHNFYTIQDELGRGTTGIVKLAIDKQNQNTFAVKVIDKTRFWDNGNTQEKLYREILILKRLRHPNIISYVDIFDGEKNLYIILELGEIELFDIIIETGGLQEQDTRRFFSELLSAVQYLHSQGIVHRDIKPENIMLTKEMKIKLTDFGLARITENAGLMTTLCGTPQYLAPEIIAFGKRGKTHNIQGYDKSVDLWSLGVVLYVMIAAESPFDAEDRHSLFSQIESGSYSFDSKKFINYSDDAKDLLSKLLTVNPLNRATINQAYNHPWINQTPAMPPPQTPPKQKKRRQPFTDLAPPNQKITIKKRRLMN